ncbi:MAG: zinc-binding dehydrogenase [Bacteroidia bacterium]|nr:zinc-binding dehydrogenase [Bacteroidia bacterium]
MYAWRLHGSLPRGTSPTAEKVWESVLRWEEVELPPLPPSYVRIELSAAALNRRDLWIGLGLYPGIQYPTILGSDGCGVVKEIGANTDPALIGQRVLINPALEWGTQEKAQAESFHILGMPTWGTFAEYVDVPAENVHPAPIHLSDRETAAVPLAGLTAYRATFVQGKLQPGEKVLVPGIGGGVAVWALQLAVAAGAEVWVTSSHPEKIALARQLGAQGGVLYTDAEWAEKLVREAGHFDLIVDGIGGEAFSSYQTLIAPGGRIVVYGATRGNPPLFDLRRTFWRQIHIIGSTMGSPANFTSLLHFIEEKKIRPFIQSLFPLSMLPEALTRLWRGEQIGKIVLQRT